MGLGAARNHHSHHSHHKSKLKAKEHCGQGFLEDIGREAKQIGKQLAKSCVCLGSDFIQNKIEG